MLCGTSPRNVDSLTEGQNYVLLGRTQAQVGDQRWAASQDLKAKGVATGRRRRQSWLPRSHQVAASPVLLRAFRTGNPSVPDSDIFEERENLGMSRSGDESLSSSFGSIRTSYIGQQDDP